MQTRLNTTVMHSRTPKKAVRLFFLISMVLLTALIAQNINARALLYNVAREQAKNVFARRTDDWPEISGEYFTVRYRDEDAAYASLVLETAEDIYAPVTTSLGYYPTAKTLVVIYPDRERLNGSFGWSAQESAMGVYWAGVIRLLSPGAWIKESDPDHLAAVFRRDGPVAHEFAHLLLDYRTSGNYPRWFTEGVAQHQEFRLTGDIWAIESENPEYYSLAELSGAFDRLPNQGMAYYQSFLLVDYLIRQWGEDGLDEIIRELAAGSGIEKAIEAVTGFAYAEFELAWLDWASGK
jgi:hypothetical protein